MSIADIWSWLINADLIVGAMWAGGIIIAFVVGSIPFMLLEARDTRLLFDSVNKRREEEKRL